MAKHRYQIIPLDQKLEWLERVPTQIAKVRQWLCFRLEAGQDGKYDKVPYYADGGKRYGKQGRPDDMQRLVRLTDAIARMRKGKADGVGFAPVEHGAASAIDFDGAESVSENANVLTRTWSEVSVGGIGAHAFVLGDLESNHKARSIGIELFSSSGFVAVTGEPLVGCEDVPIRGKRVARKVVAKITNGRPHAHVAGIPVNIPTPYSARERDKIKDALKVFRCKNADYQQWLMVGQALHSADSNPKGEPYRLWLEWSKRDDSLSVDGTERFKDEEDLWHRWVGFKGDRGITLATLYGYARDIRAKREKKKKRDPDDESSPIILTDGGDPTAIDWLIPKIVAEGQLSVVVADGGMGKSVFAYRLAHLIACGGRWPLGGFEDQGIDLKPQGKTAIVCGEEDIGAVASARRQVQGTPKGKILFMKREKGTLALIENLDEIEKVLMDKEIRLLIVDPLTGYLDVENQNSEYEVRQALEALLGMAQRTKISILALIHPNKRADMRIVDRIMGASAFKNVPRVVWGIAPNPEVEGERIAAIIKTNVTRPGVGLSFRIRSVKHPANPLDTIAYAELTGESEYDVDIDALVRQHAKLQNEHEESQGTMRGWIFEALRERIVMSGSEIIEQVEQDWVVANRGKELPPTLAQMVHNRLSAMCRAGALVRGYTLSQRVNAAKGVMGSQHYALPDNSYLF